jgi:hypothetical protein
MTTQANDLKKAIEINGLNFFTVQPAVCAILI